MLKYLNYSIYVKEIPDELSLGITCIGCPVHCSECHSKHVWDINSNNIGKELTYNELHKIFYPNHKLVSCLLFFGGEWDDNLLYIIKEFKTRFTHKVGLYTGLDLPTILDRYSLLLNTLDYIKVGPYIPEFGGLDNPNTNQRLYKLTNGNIDENITFKLQRNLNNE